MSPGLLSLAYGIIVVVAVYGFMYIPNKREHKKTQEPRNPVKAGDIVATIGGVIGKVVEREGEYLTLTIDEKKNVTMKIVLYTVSQKIEKREGTWIREG